MKKEELYEQPIMEIVIFKKIGACVICSSTFVEDKIDGDWEPEEDGLDF